MSYSRYASTAKENGYSWYECNCCPYGYHIDLDFVRYCESISKEADTRTGSIKRRKDRRRQRQSMEVLLGLLPPLTPHEDTHKPIQEEVSPKIVEKPTLHFPFINNDAFDDAVSDFERTLQRSKNKLSNNLPDVTAVSENLRRVPSFSSVSSNSGSLTVQDGAARQDFDTASVESCGLSSMALQNIRESLALSLERTKVLEDQVKIIPGLKDQLEALKEENLRLHEKLKLNNTSINLNYLPVPTRTRSQSFTHLDGLNNIIKKEPPTPPPRKDFGVMCGVLTRNIGVGHQCPNTKNAATATTPNGEFADKWLSEKVKFMNSQNLLNNTLPQKTVSVAKGTQTLFAKKEIKDSSTQHIEVLPRKTMVNVYTQSAEKKKTISNVGVMAAPRLSDSSVQQCVECFSVGCSEDTIEDVICEKCNAFKRTVAVGPDRNEDTHTGPISLASLSSRSKSFNLGEDKLNLHTRTRTVATQYEIHNVSNRASQCEVKTHSKFCQHEIKLAEKNTQYENTSVCNKQTDTKDLKSPVKHVACEAIEVKVVTKHVGSNTDEHIKQEKSVTICSKCLGKDGQDVKKEIGSPTASRIPRPQIPTTPVEVRKFRRQDTYTKIYDMPSNEVLSPTSPTRLSGLDLSQKSISTESISPIDKVKQNFKLDPVPSSSKAQNGVSTSPVTKVQIQETTLPVSESTIFQPAQSQNRKKAVPSKEMQGAMKVLNDLLQKNPSKSFKNNSAVNIVQQEWFKISSLVTANPLDVEDYLDAFEDMSYLLLQYIVNMSDQSGNTAMHYAVSHGNFDVVSILLDSKVCDINKPNKAGYTSVMLVSLAEVRSQTHANVVKRLFQLADVNIRAKQHGQTALMLAVSHGRLDMVKMLLEAGADINIQDEDGSTALMCAAEHGHIEIVKHFLTHPDCDSSITDVDGSTALKIAMEAEHRHIGVLLYAHERNFQKLHYNKIKKTKSLSPKTPSSPLPIRSSHRALTDTKK